MCGLIHCKKTCKTTMFLNPAIAFKCYTCILLLPVPYARCYIEVGTFRCNTIHLLMDTFFISIMVMGVTSNWILQTGKIFILAA